MEKNKSIRETYQTPAFRLSYPNVFEPKETLNGDMKYGATMLFPKSTTAAKLVQANHPAKLWIPKDDMKGLWQIVVKIAKANFGPEVELSSLKLPRFRDGDKPKDNGTLAEGDRGMIILNATSKDKFEAIRGDKTQITDREELYPGCWCRAVLTVAPFFKPTRGVTLYMNGIQKLADDTTFSSRPRAVDIFDEVATTPKADDEGLPWMDEKSDDPLG